MNGESERYHTDPDVRTDIRVTRSNEAFETSGNEIPRHQDRQRNIPSGNLTSNFWHRFVAEHWEFKTFCEPREFVELPIPENELFDALVKMCEEHLVTPNYDGIAIYVEGNLLESNFENLLPNSSDQSFAGYRERVLNQLNGADFSFLIDGIEMTASLRRWTYNFLTGMYGPLGRISFGHFWSIFFGSYTTTPYGVHSHVDTIGSESAFYFPLSGTKEMLTWKPDYVENNPELKNSLDYRLHEKHATVLSAERAGMMYWPSDRWHVGSSKSNDTSIVLAIKSAMDVYIFFCQSIVFGMNGANGGEGICDSFIHSNFRLRIVKSLTYVLAAIRILSLKASGTLRRNKMCDIEFDPSNLQLSASAVPQSLQRMSWCFGPLLGKYKTKALVKFWLLHLTVLGMETKTRRHEAIQLEPLRALKRNISTPILWSVSGADTIMAAANLFAQDFPAQYLPMIKKAAEIPDGGLLNYEELAQSYCGDDSGRRKKNEDNNESVNNFGYKSINDVVAFLSTSGAYTATS